MNMKLLQLELGNKMGRQAIDVFYDDAYEEVMGTGLIGKYWQLIHKQIEKLSQPAHESTVLEIGAGHGQHFDQTNPVSLLYIETDIRESMGYEIDLRKKDLNLTGRIKRLANAENLSVIPDSSVDSVVVTCVLAHLTNPDVALAEWRRILKIGGNLVVYIPCEPGLILRVVRFFTTRRKFKRFGVRQEDLHWLEHRNHFLYLKLLIRGVFKGDRVRFFKHPFALLPWDCNLYYILYVIKV
jgi:ubiquinone/menaquinone biosynthesis C-methylase UbiE